MSDHQRDVLPGFQPRQLTSGERELLSNWLGLAGDVACAYVSGRKSDDPALYRRIVVAAGPGDQPTHLIHAPDGRRVWVKMTIRAIPQMEMFETLRTALNSIQPVLA